MKSSKIDIFADDVYRNSIFIEKLNLSFCQFFVKSPSGSILCIETGMRDDFSQLKSNLLTVGINVGSVSGIVAPHFEADDTPSVRTRSPTYFPSKQDCLKMKCRSQLTKS